MKPERSLPPALASATAITSVSMPSMCIRHYASSICRTILSEGIRLGATKAYLQVVEGNTPAITLYESLGFSYLYTYWFRAKNVV